MLEPLLANVRREWQTSQVFAFPTYKSVFLMMDIIWHWNQLPSVPVDKKLTAEQFPEQRHASFLSEYQNWLVAHDRWAWSCTATINREFVLQVMTARKKFATTFLIKLASDLSSGFKIYHTYELFFVWHKKFVRWRLKWWIGYSDDKWLSLTTFIRSP